MAALAYKGICELKVLQFNHSIIRIKVSMAIRKSAPEPLLNEYPGSILGATQDGMGKIQKLCCVTSWVTASTELTAGQTRVMRDRQ